VRMLVDVGLGRVIARRLFGVNDTDTSVAPDDDDGDGPEEQVLSALILAALDGLTHSWGRRIRITKMCGIAWTKELPVQRHGNHTWLVEIACGPRERVGTDMGEEILLPTDRDRGGSHQRQPKSWPQ